jgi:hypothetical protein
MQIFPQTGKIIIGSPTQLRGKTCASLIHGQSILLDLTGIRVKTEDIFTRREIFRRCKMNKCHEPSAQEIPTRVIILGNQDNQM